MFTYHPTRPSTLLGIIDYPIIINYVSTHQQCFIVNKKSIRETNLPLGFLKLLDLHQSYVEVQSYQPKRMYRTSLHILKVKVWNENEGVF